MVAKALAHISDLHIGRDAKTDAAVVTLRDALLAADVDQVLLTGDVTHRGRRAEFRAFERLAGALLGQGGGKAALPAAA
jgi:3',5'-cyclic-AMP phosphodiesterase